MKHSEHYRRRLADLMTAAAAANFVYPIRVAVPESAARTPYFTKPYGKGASIRACLEDLRPVDIAPEPAPQKRGAA